MMKHKNFHPEICKLLDLLSELEDDCQYRANDLLADDITRARAQATRDAYAFCRFQLRNLDV